MSELALFAIGTVVFFLGGVGLVLYGLDTFQAWNVREGGEDEHPHLDDETVGDALKDPRRHDH